MKINSLKTHIIIAIPFEAKFKEILLIEMKINYEIKDQAM